MKTRLSFGFFCGAGPVAAVTVMVSFLLSSVGWTQDETPQLYMLETTGYRDEVSTIVPEKTDQVVRDRFESNAKVDLSEKYDPNAGDKSGNAAIEEAKRLYNSGIGLLVSEDYKGAQDAFRQAIALFEASLAELDSYEILHDAHLRLGLAYIKAEYDLDAREVLKVYVSLDPDAKVSKKDFPPDLVAIVEKEQRRIKKRGTGVLDVGSNPEGAEVFLDGKSIGKTPVKLEDVLPGTHYLVVKGGGTFAFGKKISVRGKDKVEKVVANLESSSSEGTSAAGPVFLTELERRIGEGEVDESLNPYLAELTSRTGSGFVAFVIVRRAKSGFTAKPFLFSAKEDAMVLLEDQSFDRELSNLNVEGYKLSQKYLEAMKEWPGDLVVTTNPFKDEAVAAAVTPPRGPVGGTTGPKTGGTTKTGPGITEPFVPSTDDEGWYEKWWVWAGVGVIVVGGAVATGVLLLDEEDDSDSRGFTATVNW